METILYVMFDLKFDSFLELYQQSIKEFVIKSADAASKSKLNINRSINKIISFVYVIIMEFGKSNLSEGHIFNIFS